MAEALNVVNLTKKFGALTAIRDITFASNPGEILGLLGPNGAGKTTTIRTIATLLTPTAGSAAVCGYDIKEAPNEVRRNLGVLMTEVGVYDRFSGRENLSYIGKLYNLSGEALTKRINILSDLLEMGEFIDRPAGGYSTGMKQKLAIARSIIHDPPVIIFDEPTAGLDVLAAQTVLDFMRQAKSMGKSVVFSTHQMSYAEKLCDRVVIIHRGQLIAEGAVSEIMARTGTGDLEDAFLALVEAKNA